MVSQPQVATEFTPGFEIMAASMAGAAAIRRNVKVLQQLAAKVFIGSMEQHSSDGEKLLRASWALVPKIVQIFN
jgi:hypothetical protein